MPALRKALAATEAEGRKNGQGLSGVNSAFADCVTPLPDIFNAPIQPDTDIASLPMNSRVVHYVGGPPPWDSAYPGA